MNDVFYKKSPKLYIISQKFPKNNNIKNHYNPILDQLSFDKQEFSSSPKLTSIKAKKLKNNEALISINKRIRFPSANKRKLDNFQNYSKISSFINKYSFQKKDNIKQVINNYFKNENEYNSNYHRNNKIDMGNNYKLKKFPSEKLSNTTEIIQKKIKYHDLDAQTRKKSENYYTPLLTKKNKNIEKTKEEKSNEYTYITVYGVLFSKNNNLKYLKKKPKNLVMNNINSTQSKLWKKPNNANLFPLSLPWLINLNNKRNKNSKVFGKDDLSKSLKKTNYLNETEKDKPKIQKDIIGNENIDIKENKKIKKLIYYDMISIAGSDHGRININQDSYFIIQKLDNCDEVKVFGIFDGHGDNGDKISREIRDFFKEYFCNMFNKNIKNNEIKTYNNIDDKKLNFMNTIKIFKNIIQFNSYNIKNIKYYRDKIKNETPKNNNFIEKLKNKKINFNLFEEKKINLHNNSFLKSKINDEAIKNIYNKLSQNNYSEIFSSYKKMDEILHKKYFLNKFCHLSGSTSLILFLINDKNYNKIISTNLGDSKIISISEDNKIKELNITHTPNNSDEKNRVLKNGGVIARMDLSNVGPLRIWFKNKKYPGLSITRSFGDLESDELGVISEPDIKEYDIDEEKIKIIVFGTDGVWKFMTNDKIMNIVLPYYSQNDANGATKKISETAIKLWNIKNPKGIADVTVFVLFFK